MKHKHQTHTQESVSRSRKPFYYVSVLPLVSTVLPVREIIYT